MQRKTKMEKELTVFWVRLFLSCLQQQLQLTVFSSKGISIPLSKGKRNKNMVNCIRFYFRIYQFTTVDKTKHVGRTCPILMKPEKRRKQKSLLVPYDEIKIYLQLSHLSNQGYSFIFNFLGSLFKLSNVLVFSFC